MGSRQSKVEDIETLDFNSISKALSEIDIDEIEARYGGSEEFESAFGLCGNEIGKIESWLGLPNTFVAEGFYGSVGQTDARTSVENGFEVQGLPTPNLPILDCHYVISRRGGKN